MTGACLIGFIILGIVSSIIKYIDDFYEEFWNFLSIACFNVAVFLIISIPISRIDSKQNAEYAKVFQETLNANRVNEQDMNVFERATIMEEINECNTLINKWRVKGEKWYHNKWYYHPNTQKVEFIK